VSGRGDGVDSQLASETNKMKIQPSASRSALLLECSYAFSVEIEPEPGGEPSRYGVAFHSLLAFLLLKKGSRDGYDRVVDAAVKANRLPPSSARDLAGHARGSYQVLYAWLKGKNPWGRDFLKGQKMEVEKSFALRMLGPPVGSGLPIVRKISPPSLEEHCYEDLLPGEIAGTADLILGDLVLDHKTGQAETFEQPAEKPQLKTLALIPLYRGGMKREEWKPIAGVLHAPRLGLPEVYADEVEDLPTHEAALSRSLARIGDGSLRPGPWCSRCPAREVCPAQHGDLLKRSGEIVKSSMGIKEFLDGDDHSRSIMGPSDIGKIHLLFHQLEALLKVGKKEIRQWVEDHPEEVAARPDGKELALVSKRYERLSKSSIIEALGKLKGEKELARLRKLGAISEDERVELHAVPGAGR